MRAWRQAALLRFQPPGTVSVTDPLVVNASARLPVSPEPVMVTGLPPLGAGDTAKVKT